MDTGILITGCIGLITSVVSGWTSWFFTRRKYNSEVDSNLISNMKESLEFYEKLSNDNKLRLEEVLKRNAELEQEVGELKKQMFNLMSSICIDLTCQVRQRSLNLFNEKVNKSSKSSSKKKEQ